MTRLADLLTELDHRIRAAWCGFADHRWDRWERLPALGATWRWCLRCGSLDRLEGPR